MGLGSILFFNSEAGPPKQKMDTVGTEKTTSLLDDERVLRNLLEGVTARPVLRRQKAPPRLAETQTSGGRSPTTGISTDVSVGWTAIRPLDVPT